MGKTIKLGFLRELERLPDDYWNFIQVILGPRQVGKTTGIKAYLKQFKPTQYHYSSADGEVSQPAHWIEEQWALLRAKADGGLLVIDEVQKVENWSEILKKLFDKQKDFPLSERIKVIVLGSSSLTIQQGLSESLTGRFRLIKTYTWNLAESRRAYGLSLDEFLSYGGYPGSYVFKENLSDWLAYMQGSIIDTVIGKDILRIARVKSPALFKQCFHLACSYGGQEISYTKLLGQLQDSGNVELVKHYLELFEGAFLMKVLSKYSAKKVLQRSSSPKLLPLCPALYAQSIAAPLNAEERGRAFEIAIGAELNRLEGELYYWREGKYEVDYIYKHRKRIFAIEVKSGGKTGAKGLSKFCEKFSEAEPLIVTTENFARTLEKLRALS